MNIKFLILCISFLLTTTRLLSVDYYLSNTGNDSNNGTSSATPWRTLAKLSAELGGSSGTWGTISTGDRVYFRRGDTFRGTIAFAAYNNNGITFDSYDSGALPIIKGSKLVTNWTVHSGNIWKATVAEQVYFLYVDGVLQTLSRTPNTDTWNLSTATSNALTSSSIGSSGKNFVGANVCVREYDWQLNRQVVTSQSGNTVTWATSIAAAGANANFYFDNKLELLDTEGEWFYNAANQTLYFMSSTNPNNLSTEASVNLLGIGGNDNRSDNTFQNLEFQHYAQEGIRLMGAANNNVIQNCVFIDNFQAMFVSGSGNSIQNNSITDSYYQGAVLANMGNGSFSNNSITNAGMTFGQHRPNFNGSFYSGGIWLINGNAGCTIGNNTITNVGNMGIRFNGTGITIERNQVENTMVNMDDGGGIYTWGGNNSSYNNTIRNNIVSTMVGSHNGTAPGNIINGIYIDNDAYNITVENNTVRDITGSGIIINAGAHNCPITGNVTYRCKQGLGFYDWQSGQSIYANTASGNTFYANITDAIPIEIASNDGNHNVMSTSNNNYLCNPYGTSVGRYLWTNAQTFTMAQWRTTTGYDLASVGSYYNWTWPTDHSFLEVNNTNAAATYTYSNVVNLDNMSVTSLTLQPFTSKVLITTIPLPVTYLAPLKGHAVPNMGIELSWATATEQDADRFEIQRSNDGISFEKIGTLSALGHSSHPQNYHFWDKKPMQGYNYYRLQQVDFDEKFSLSNIVKVDWTSFNINVFPNPAADIFEIRPDFGWERALLRNALGQVVKTFYSAEKTTLDGLPYGVYSLEIFEANNEIPVVVRLIKQ
jgi:parallel beta-helix repeat protein